MARTMAVILLVLVLSPGAALVTTRAVSETETQKNPIRKVVSLLQNMQKKVTEEGAKEKELFEKFACYCKTSGGDLQASISAAEAKVPEVSSEIKETEGKIVQLEEDLKQHQVDRTAAKDAMADATAIREKTAAAFAKDESDLSTNIAALGKAISAIESGMVGAFIQSSSAKALRRVIVDRVDMSDFDRERLASFLGMGTSQAYAPASGEIVGILKELKSTMSKDLTTASSAEEESIKSFQELMTAKKKEVKALTASIETKTERLGEAKVAVVQMEQDLSDTQKALEDDKAFLTGLDTNCADKTAEHEANMKVRAEELVAIAEVIKVLNDDDALELFKKTLPSASSASFVQMHVRPVAATPKRQRAIEMIQAVQGRKGASRPGLDFIILAMKGKKVSFEKVLKMIDEMVALLATEQKDDDSKKEYCLLSFDKIEDKMKELNQAVADLKVTIEKEADEIAALTEEIKALEKSVVALDKSVAEATEQRQEEHAAMEELVSSDQAAKEILAWAKNRLNKFYNPSLYKAPPKRVLTEEEKIYTTFGGALPAFVQINAHHQQKSVSDVAPPPPPETAAAYTKQAAASDGVLYMIDTLVKDLDKEITEATTADKEAQKDYETAMGEAAAKRAQDTKSITDKEGAKADLSEDLQKHNDEKEAKSSSLIATSKVMGEMHEDCDWLLQNFEVRKEARAGEVESLKQAKAVLSGADFSLVQSSK